MKNYSPYQFSLLRITLGLYVFFYFSKSLAHSAHFFYWLPALNENFLTEIIIGCALCALLFTLGVWRRTTAPILLCGFAALTNPYISLHNPGFLFIAWLLLINPFIAPGEPLVLTSKSFQKNPDWSFSPVLYWLSVFFTCCIYVGAILLKHETQIWNFRAGILLMHIFIFYGPWFPAKNKNALVFFDGVCGLCDRFVDFAITEDRERVLRFTPLQGITAKEYAERLSTVKTDSIILIDDTGIYDRSCAVLRICSQMGNIWRCTAIFYLVPKFIRNFIYDSVAKNRYNIFGKNEVCRFPTPEERGKILP